MGFLIDDLYRDAPVNAAQAVGQDLITLVVALPVLVVSAVLALRGSMRAHLVWLGALGYLVYTYLSYALAIEFNSLFLVHVALVGLSLYTLIGGLATTDFVGIKARFSRGTPLKAVSIVVHVLDMALLLPANVLTAIWLWRRRAQGYVLAETLLSLLSILVLAIISMPVFQVLYGVVAVAEAVGIAVVFGGIFAISLGMLLWYLRGLNE